MYPPTEMWGVGSTYAPLWAVGAAVLAAVVTVLLVDRLTMERDESPPHAP